MTTPTPTEIRARRRRVKRASIDAVLTFRHDGAPVLAVYASDQWNPGYTSRTITWRTDDGREIQTRDIPADADVLTDPSRGAE